MTSFEKNFEEKIGLSLNLKFWRPILTGCYYESVQGIHP